MIFKKTLHTVLSQTKKEKSGRDGILITVDFNLRSGKVLHSPQNPAGTMLCIEKVPSLRDFENILLGLFRRLKSTVNQVFVSARHFAANKTFFHFQLIFFLNL